MDPLIAERLNSKSEWYDDKFHSRIASTARQYIDTGLASLNFYIPDLDAATDLICMYAPIDDPNNFAKLERNAAINFRHPMTFIQIHTMTTFVAQILFGGETARSVDAQKDEEEDAADDINALLKWNDQQLGIYLQGWLWVWAALAYNRGIWYEGNGQDKTVSWEEVEEEDFTKEPEIVYKKDGVTPKTVKGKPVLKYPLRTRLRMKRDYTGFKNTLHIVSPYDFVCDPMFPACQFQEGRFAGHRVIIPWYELKRRSELDPSDDEYVLPDVVTRIREQKGSTTIPAALGQTQGMNTSRTYYDRMLRGAAATGLGGIGSGLVPGADAVNKQDGGAIECFSMTIRQKPTALGMYDDDEATLITMLITNQADILSLNLRNNEHDQFPYCLGEGRPNAHRQLTPGWALAEKPVQDRVDDLNRTHSTAQKRMGNILIVDDTKCDVANLTAPDKNGLLIRRTAQGKGQPSDDLVTQIKLQDTTAGYPEEMAGWIKTGQDVTGVQSFVQGTTEDPSQTATQFEGTQQMATGRISSVARVLSELGLVPQTRRFVMNFQQYMPDEMMVRVIGKGSEFDPDNPPPKFKVVKKADIQVGFDVAPHDGSLPGADAKIVAAASRAVEAYSTNPALAPVFDTTIPGALDPNKIFRDLLKKTGLPVGEYVVTTQQAQKNALAKAQSQGMPMQQASDGSVPPQPVAAPPPVDATGMPSANTLPPTPPATPPPPGANLT